MAPFRRTALALALASAIPLGVVLGACFPSYAIGVTSDGGPSLEGSPPGVDAPSMDAHEAGPGLDAAPETTSGIDGAVPSDGGGFVVATGSKAVAAGYGYQTHLIHANHDGRYWLFYVDDTAERIATVVSSDRVHWSSGASIPMPTGTSPVDGSGFSVAYADVGGADVVHVVANVIDSSGPRYASFHVRCTIAAGVLVPGSPQPLPDTDTNGATGSSGDSCPLSGPHVVVTATGDVYDVTAWSTHSPMNTQCDTNVYHASVEETGGTWNSSAPFLHDGYFWAWPQYALSHELVELPESGSLMAIYPDEDINGTVLYSSFGWIPSASFDAGGSGVPGDHGFQMDAAAELFWSSDTQSSYDDWASCRLTDQEIHLMRHATVASGTPQQASTFEEVVYDGTQWNASVAPPDVTSLANTGLVLLSGADPSRGMLRAVVAVDNSIDIVKWTSATGWNHVSTVPATTVTRQGLAGTGCGFDPPTLLWTEGSAATHELHLLDVSGLL